MDIASYTSRSRALDLSGIDWNDVPRHEISADTVRALRYMQDIEAHTIVYLRSLLSTRVIDDDEIATFLACWFYEETFHGDALARFLHAAGHATVHHQRSRPRLAQRFRYWAPGFISRWWENFAAVHMTWGAINELTTLTGYQRLQEVAAHPVLTELLARIIRDESRHFSFYYHQAERRLAHPATQRVARFVVDRYWAPVGTGVQPPEEVRFMARYLLDGSEGREAARRVDENIRRLPGFAGVELVEAWVARAA